MRHAATWTLCITLLAGCATTWTKPGLSDRDYARDDYECERDAQSLSNLPALTQGGLIAAAQYGMAASKRREMYGRCMAARGYSPAGAASAPVARRDPAPASLSASREDTCVADARASGLHPATRPSDYLAAVRRCLAE